MKRILKLFQNQMYLALRQSSFWIGMLLTGGYAVIAFLNDCNRYWGYDSGGTRAASELFLYSTNHPLWDVFSLVIPFLCVFAFGMQPIEDRESRIDYCTVSRMNKREYYISGALCNMAGTFLITEIPALFCMALYGFTFEETGFTYDGAKYSDAYWYNVSQNGYRLQMLHTERPWLYVLLYSILFSTGCAVVALFFYACATLIKKEKLWMLLLAAAMSFAIKRFYDHTGYEIYGDIVVSRASKQNGIPTVILGCFFLITGVVILQLKCRETDDE